MIICVEGPDFSGKTTHVNMLASYIKSNYPNMSVSTIHFPTTKTNNYMDLILKPEAGNQINNPMFVANAFISDMYMRMNNTKETITFNGEIGALMTIKEINEKYPSKFVFIIDRYFYSTLIMCSLYNENIYKEQDKEKIKEYWQKIQGMISLMITQYELPIPDMNIVLLPTWDSITSRVEAAKRKNLDVFENKELLSRTYSLYLDAVSYSSVFNINGEQLVPFVIKDSRVVCPFNNQKDSDNSISIKLIGRLNKNSDIQNIESIQKDIRAIFDNYIDFRRDISTGKLTGPDIEKFIEQRGIKGESNIYFSHEKMSEEIPDDESLQPVDELPDTSKGTETRTEETTPTQTISNEQSEDDGKETMFQPKNGDLVIMHLNKLDIEYVAEIKSMYELDDYEMYIYDTMGMSVDKIMNNPDKFILPSTYKTEERMAVLRIVLKILASYKTEKNYPANKVSQITRYIKSKFEALTVKKKYGKKADAK